MQFLHKIHLFKTDNNYKSLNIQRRDTMAFINGTFYSNVLEQEVMLDLYLPNDREEKSIEPPVGVVYFLHGMGSSHKRFR